MDRLWSGVAHQRCTVHKLCNLLAKAPQHTHEAVREEYHRTVYGQTLAAAEKGREVFRDFGGQEKAAAQKRNSMTSQAKGAIHFSTDSGTLPG